MTEEKIKSRLDDIWSIMPEIKEGIKIIKREQFDSLCKSMMRLGQLKAASDVRELLAEYVQKI